MNLMYKLGMELNQQAVGQREALRTQETLLGRVRITEELKSGDEGNDSEKDDRGALWHLGALFGVRRPSPTPSLSDSSEEEESPSLSSSFGSELDARSSSVRSVDSAPKKIMFNEEVAVCLIPKRDEYSKRIRGHLWNSPEEMAAAAHRNSIEFAAEGWDAKNCMEEENMYRCLKTNELIHPVHVEQAPSPTM